jgi:hypothetical protein
VHGQAPDFEVHLEAWARSEGHRVGHPAKVVVSTCSAGKLNPDAGKGPNVLATRIRESRRAWWRNRPDAGAWPLEVPPWKPGHRSLASS